MDDLWSLLPELLAGQDTLMWATGAEPEDDRAVHELLGLLRTRARGASARRAGSSTRAPTSTSSAAQVGGEPEVMRRAAAITDEAHRALMATAAPGVNECELDALLDYTFRRRGGTGAAYNNIVAGGANACILHYVENDQPLEDGALCLVDAGTELEHYASDVTRTFPVSGTFTDAQRRVYEVVLAAQEASIAQCRPGVPFDAVHEASLDVLVDGMIELGLCSGTRAEVIESGAYRQWFMHRTSHWLGIDVHDCGAYDDATGSRPLEPGMVLTVEPASASGPRPRTRPAETCAASAPHRGRHPHPADGHENLTAAVPKTIAEEAACQARRALRGSGIPRLVRCSKRCEGALAGCVEPRPPTTRTQRLIEVNTRSTSSPIVTPRLLRASLVGRSPPQRTGDPDPETRGWRSANAGAFTEWVVARQGSNLDLLVKASCSTDQLRAHSKGRKSGFGGAGASP